MKTRIFLFVGFFLLNTSISKSRGAVPVSDSLLQSQINIYSSPELFDLLTIWAAQYNQLNSKLNVNVIKPTGVYWSSILDSGKLGFFNDQTNLEKFSKDSWFLAVGHDVLPEPSIPTHQESFFLL